MDLKRLEIELQYASVFLLKNEIMITRYQSEIQNYPNNSIEYLKEINKECDTLLKTIKDTNRYLKHLRSQLIQTNFH